MHTHSCALRFPEGSFEHNPRTDACLCSCSRCSAARAELHPLRGAAAPPSTSPNPSPSPTPAPTDPTLQLVEAITELTAAIRQSTTERWMHPMLTMLGPEILKRITKTSGPPPTYRPPTPPPKKTRRRTRARS